MADKKMINKPVTIVGKVDKVNGSSSFTLRTSDGKFSFLCGSLSHAVFDL